MPPVQRESDVPFLTQFAQGNTREHLGECDKTLISAKLPTLQKRPRDQRDVYPHLSFSLEDTDLFSQATKLKIKA